MSIKAADVYGMEIARERESPNHWNWHVYAQCVDEYVERSGKRQEHAQARDHAKYQLKQVKKAAVKKANDKRRRERKNDAGF